MSCGSLFQAAGPEYEKARSPSLNFVRSLGRQHHTHHHNRFTALFLWLPGWAGARRELLDFMV